MSSSTRTEGAGLDAALLAVIANRLDSVCREMTNTLLRSGRSAVLNMARQVGSAVGVAVLVALMASQHPSRLGLFQYFGMVGLLHYQLTRKPH